MFLTDSELCELTGFRQAGKQAAWLRDHKWRFTTTAHGQIRVARAYFERKLVGEASSPERGPEPDFEAIARRA